MSKELEALQYLKENKRRHWLDNDKSNECLDIIEKALKEKETPTETFEQFVGESSEVIYKKLKALEIIKEKGCLQFCMFGVSLKDYNISVDIVNKDYGFERYKHYNQAEYDLVKEVLL